MVTASSHPDRIQLVQQVLTDPAKHLSDTALAELQEMIQAGALIFLREDASTEAIDLLALSAQTHPIVSIRNLAIETLVGLCDAGSTAAVDQLFNIAINAANSQVRQILSVHPKWVPTQVEQKTLLDWMVAAEEGKEIPVDLNNLTKGFFLAGPDTQKHILFLAKTPGYRNWAKLLDALTADHADELSGIGSLYGSLSQAEQSIAIKELEKIAPHTTVAQDVLCQLFIEYGDQRARDIAIANSYRPNNPIQQSVFFFLAGDIERFNQIDYDHSLLTAAYTTASRSLRRRMLAYSRQSGQVAWLRISQQLNEGRWLADLSDPDWDIAIRKLVDQEKYQELWRLAQSAPPVWSAIILNELTHKNWKPAIAIEAEAFTHLSMLAVTAAKHPFYLRSSGNLKGFSDQIFSMAIHPQNNLLAAGCTGQPIYLWSLPKGDMRYPGLIGPASTTRSLCFSQDGELIVAANGDQRIRFFRHSNSQIIKTLEGHRGLIRALALQPSGRLLASAGFDGVIRFWRFPIGTTLKIIQNDVKEIFALSFFSNGDLLAAGGAGDSLSIWSAPDGNRLRSIPCGPAGITHLSASRQSEWVAGAGRSTEVKIWNGINGSLLQEIQTGKSLITGIQMFSNDSLLFTSHADGTIKVWNPQNGALWQEIRAHRSAIVSLALSNDGRILASADDDGSIKLWDLYGILWLRTPYQAGRALPVDDLVRLAIDPELPEELKTWYQFSAALWKWIRRYEIEISEPATIHAGEFDIEL